jgi:hypothetical protein
VVDDPVGTGDPVADGVGVLVEVGDTELVGAALGPGAGVLLAVVGAALAGSGAARSPSSPRPVHAGAATTTAASSHAAGRRMLTP